METEKGFHIVCLGDISKYVAKKVQVRTTSVLIKMPCKVSKKFRSFENSVSVEDFESKGWLNASK